jgi:hypothetical protein
MSCLLRSQWFFFIVHENISLTKLITKAMHFLLLQTFQAMLSMFKLSSYLCVCLLFCLQIYSENKSYIKTPFQEIKTKPTFPKEKGYDNFYHL